MFGHQVSQAIALKCSSALLTNLSCSLAYAELYAGLAAVIRRFGPRMRLYETSFEEDIKCIADFFVPVQKSGRGVRVTIDKA